MDELSDDLKKLEESKKLDLSKFIDFLLKTFPIKHKKNFKWPKVVPGNERKVCILLSALYHPDEVKEEEHGLKYKVLCEEIVKHINEREKYGW